MRGYRGFLFAVFEKVVKKIFFCVLKLIKKYADTFSTIRTSRRGREIPVDNNKKHDYDTNMNQEEINNYYLSRRTEIYKKNKEGKSYSQLANEYHITASRVGAIIKKARKEQKNETEIAKG